MKCHNISYYELQQTVEGKYWHTINHIDSSLSRSEAEKIADDLTNGEFTSTGFYRLTGPHTIKILGK